jgi:hypothetical protein
MSWSASTATAARRGSMGENTAIPVPIREAPVLQRDRVR